MENKARFAVQNMTIDEVACMATDSDTRLDSVLQGTYDAAEYQVELVEDRPTAGMWHTGPNAAWITVTHLPTMISARAFDQQHHKARESAFACCQMMVEQSRLLKCQFPERLALPTPETRSPALPNDEVTSHGY